jgi:hypothetical protein
MWRRYDTSWSMTGPEQPQVRAPDSYRSVRSGSTWQRAVRAPDTDRTVRSGPTRAWRRAQLEPRLGAAQPVSYS